MFFKNNGTIQPLTLNHISNIANFRNDQYFHAGNVNQISIPASSTLKWHLIIASPFPRFWQFSTLLKTVLITQWMHKLLLLTSSGLLPINFDYLKYAQLQVLLSLKLLCNDYTERHNSAKELESARRSKRNSG